MKKVLLLIIFISDIVWAYAQHPSLFVTAEEISSVKASLSEGDDFALTLNELVAKADKYLQNEITVPQPIDGGGGVVHEQHKQNYYAMFNCGLAYQWTKDKKYAKYVADMLMAYAKMYPSLGLHPLKISNVRGRLFWQTLNESVWLVHTSIAYDCVYDVLTKQQRHFIEKNLLYNMADFIMNGYGDYKVNNKMFNRMHNHATWATAAVGMTALVIRVFGILHQKRFALLFLPRWQICTVGVNRKPCLPSRCASSTCRTVTCRMALKHVSLNNFTRSSTCR